MKVKNIIFDASGVLYVRPKKSYQRFKHKTLPKRYGFKGGRKDHIRSWKYRKVLGHAGILSYKEWIAATLGDGGVQLKPSELNSYVRALRESSKLNSRDNTHGSLAKLKGFNLYVFSGTPYSKNDIVSVLRFVGINRHITDVFVTPDVGASKHFPLGFKRVLRSTNSSVNNTLFVGHSPHEITGAKLAGLTTVSLDKKVKGDYNISSLAELPGLVKEINSG
jgi:FMN phosphatase YigB (HAD superfamily)|tara:strand:+ start:163 stop:825 length:663 start_codon:yes stop_codon:yes gene_type:complete